MEKLTLTRVGFQDKDKDGNPYVFKTGKNQGQPYTKIGVQAKEYGELWLTGFKAKWNENWKAGDVVDVEIEKGGDKGQYLNLKYPDPVKALAERVARLEHKVFGAGNTYGNGQRASY